MFTFRIDEIPDYRYKYQWTIDGRQVYSTFYNLRKFDAELGPVAVSPSSAGVYQETVTRDLAPGSSQLISYRSELLTLSVAGGTFPPNSGVPDSVTFSDEDSQGNVF